MTLKPSSQTESRKISGSNESLIENWVSSAIQDILWEQYESIMIQGDIYLSSALYLVYWYHRTKNNDTNHKQSQENAYAYFWTEDTEPINNLLESDTLRKYAIQHVEWNVLVRPTVDAVIERDGNILTLERDFFPKWPALVGWFLLDEDEWNPLNIDARIFSALRISGEKLFWFDNLEYGVKQDIARPYYFVTTSESDAEIRLFLDNRKGYKYKDDVTRMVHPSDPRHMVDAVWYSMTLVWELENSDVTWVPKDTITDVSIENGGLAFSHHREIAANVTKDKTQIDIDMLQHHHWVRETIQNPLDSYTQIKERFENNSNHAETPCPELLPVVKKMMQDLYVKEVNDFCASDTFAMAQRQLIMNDLMHCASEKDKVCPYMSTVTCIIKTVEFFDIYERIKKGFYDDWDSDKFIEQNPGKMQYAYFFRTKYKNHLDGLLASFPEEIIIPTYEHIGATDLMKVRAIPLRFVGLSNEFLYVDEFWQSPVEFLLHDGDHSMRMAMEDSSYCDEYNISREELIKSSSIFSKKYLDSIKIQKTDTEEEKEIKKLKKIICFEVTHEDSKPFMQDVITHALQTEEWADIHREGIQVDTATGFYSRGHSVETQWWVSPLSFVLHKLQHWFFDQVDNQISQIVSPKYRTAEYIAHAAYEMLRDLDTTPLEGVPLDVNGNIDYEWILKRTCSKSPIAVHHTEFRDAAIATYGDGTRF